MSERTRRILSLVKERAQNVNIRESDSEASNHDTNSSGTEYIPSSSGGSFSDDYDHTLSPKTPPIEEKRNLHNPKINIISDIQLWPKVVRKNIEDNNPKSRILDSTSLEQFEPFTFEHENDFGAECLFTSEVITSLLSSELLVVPSKKSNKEKKSNVYESPYITSNRYKKTVCKFCESEIVSKHFARHLERRHKDEYEVKHFLNLMPNSKEKKNLLSLIRNDGNLDNAIHGKIIPKKRKIGKENDESEFVICKHCKGYYKRLYLCRHSKKCFARPQGSQDSGRPLAESLTFAACQKKYGDLLNQLRIKTDLLNRMQADDVTKVITEDILIIYYGEDLLKKTKMKRKIYHISNKLRECAKFLIEMKKLRSYDDMLSTLKPENFDLALEAVKRMSRYDADSRNFGAASLPLHFRTTLINLCDLAAKLILRKRIPYFRDDVDQTLTSLERLKNLVNTQWATEIGSLALKDLHEKSATKPKLLPVTEDIIKLIKLVENTTEEAYEKLILSKDPNIYRVLVETVLVSTILHNRKRVGDVQYLEWKSFKDQYENTNILLQTELADSLTANEKILTQNYKRIISIGKGSRPVTILIPRKMQRYYGLLLKLRNEPWFPVENPYLFTYLISKLWIDGCSVIRKYSKLSKAKYPELLTSCRLRKHIATTTQLLNLQGNEIDQLAKFMGHTTKTHEMYYKLPQDLYQIAKVSKILQIMEKGNAAQFKNKTLEEIDIDMNEIDVENEINHEESNRPTQTETQVERNEDMTSQDEKDVNEYNLPVSTQNMEHNKSKGQKLRWTSNQKNMMRRFFSSQIASKKALRKSDCENFIKEHKINFENIPWLKIKTFVFQESRMKDGS